MVKLASRKQAARYMVQNYQLSERAACRLMGISRTGYRYIARPRDDEPLRSRMKELAAKQTAYGNPLLHALLRNEGPMVNHMRNYRIYLEENLQVLTRNRKKLQRPRVASKCDRVQTSAGLWILCRIAWLAVEASEF